MPAAENGEGEKAQTICGWVTWGCSSAGMCALTARQVWAHVWALGTGELLEEITEMGKGLGEAEREQLRDPGLSSWSTGAEGHPWGLQVLTGTALTSAPVT